MYAIYGNIYHQYTPNVSIYTIHGSYGLCLLIQENSPVEATLSGPAGSVHADGSSAPFEVDAGWTVDPKNVAGWSPIAIENDHL